jgi:hypothetical protein
MAFDDAIPLNLQFTAKLRGFAGWQSPSAPGPRCIPLNLEIHNSTLGNLQVGKGASPSAPPLGPGGTQHEPYKPSRLLSNKMSSLHLERGRAALCPLPNLQIFNDPSAFVSIHSLRVLHTKLTGDKFGQTCVAEPSKGSGFPLKIQYHSTLNSQLNSREFAGWEGGKPERAPARAGCHTT